MECRSVELVKEKKPFPNEDHDRFVEPSSCGRSNRPAKRGVAAGRKAKMFRQWQFLMGFSCFMTMSGCARKESATQAPPLTEKHFCERFAKAMCEKEVACGAFEKAANCEAWYQQFQCFTFESQFGVDARVEFDVAGANDCLDSVSALTNSSCTTSNAASFQQTASAKCFNLAKRNSSLPEAQTGDVCCSRTDCGLTHTCVKQRGSYSGVCQPRFAVGSRFIEANLGESWDEPCAEGAYLDAQQFCQAKVKTGEACTGPDYINPCTDPWSRCSSGVCRMGSAPPEPPLPLDLGAACTEGEKDTCRLGLICTAGQCAKRAPVGDACGATGMAQCRRDLLCDNGKCTFKFKEGATCETIAKDECEAGTLCSAIATPGTTVPPGVCERRKNLGESCAIGTWGCDSSKGYCDSATKVCVPFLAPGADCTGLEGSCGLSFQCDFTTKKCTRRVCQ